MTANPEPRVFRASDGEPMNEVLADFIGEVVTVRLKDGRIRWGRLQPEVLDDYELVLPDTGAPLVSFHRQDVVELVDWSGQP
ncbi:hypothetical protein ACFVGV_05995 [Pseudarthrobacter scleromae]|uniref:hypothetical protein n=1 Tax=Pseudarthrobacter scleromae TaxID=158897 RepID=UPI003639C42C